ncbi:hypothetical protein, partial [Kluyvera ascorbata]
IPRAVRKRLGDRDIFPAGRAAAESVKRKIATFIVCHAVVVLVGFQSRFGELEKGNRYRWSFDWHVAISIFLFFEIGPSPLKHNYLQVFLCFNLLTTECSPSVIYKAVLTSGAIC